jgi:adenylate cyclase
MADAPTPSGWGAPRVEIIARRAGDVSTISVTDRLFVGRECLGVDDDHRLIIRGDRAISRNHLEIRIDPRTGASSIVDTSSNGTRLNGVRIERASPIPIRSGDLIALGDAELEVCIVGQGVLGAVAPGIETSTAAVGSGAIMAMVVGDIINFSTVSQDADPTLIARVAEQLYGELRRALAHHHGTLANYVGDAFFAVWESGDDEVAAASAVEYAVSAANLVKKLSPSLPLSYDDGEPLRMGWGVSFGDASIRLLPGSLITVLGDVANVAFRLASVAGRHGRPPILVTRVVGELLSERELCGPFEESLKGRAGTEIVFGIETATGPADRST